MSECACCLIEIRESQDLAKSCDLCMANIEIHESQDLAKSCDLCMANIEVSLFNASSNWVRLSWVHYYLTELSRLYFIFIIQKFVAGSAWFDSVVAPPITLGGTSPGISAGVL